MKLRPTSVINLSELADIEQGHLFRKGIRNMPRGHIYLIQPYNVDPIHGLNKDELHKVSNSDVKRSSIIGPDDVIIKTKTATPIAFMVEDATGEYAVTNHFMIIRLRGRSIIPKYLTWYLNSSLIRTYLTRMMSGTNVPFLRKTTLMDLTIPVSPIDVQGRIVALDGLLRKEEKLTLKILELKKELAEQLSHNAMRGV